MPVPIPVEISIQQPPKGVKLEYASDIINLIAQSLSGTMEVSLLTGQVGGNAPKTDVGPWLNGKEWYYWTGAGYQITQQGCPIGTVAIWGGAYNIPNNWLYCDGRSLSTAAYPDLFKAIGYLWGGSGNSFNLPPGGFFFLNQPGFVFAPQVPSIPGGAMYQGQPQRWGLNARGGNQSAMMPTDAMPPLRVSLMYLNPEMIDNNINVANTQGAGSSGYYYPVTDESGNILGTNQSRVPVMPPFAAINFIIKTA